MDSLTPPEGETVQATFPAAGPPAQMTDADMVARQIRGDVERELLRLSVCAAMLRDPADQGELQQVQANQARLQRQHAALKAAHPAAFQDQ